MRDKIGVIHGRFQVLHLGHLEYLLAGKKRCEKLIIGICNPDIYTIKYSEVCPHRSLNSSNPLSYYERYEMIKNVMLEAGIQLDEFEIVPFPINIPEFIHNYVPLNATFYMTIYDEWGEEKERILSGLNVKIDVMWKRTLKDRLTSGSEVRELIYEDKEWKHLVPNATYDYLINNGLDKRIKQILSQESEAE